KTKGLLAHTRHLASMTANLPALFGLLFGTGAALVHTTANAVLMKALRGFIESKRTNNNPVQLQGSHCLKCGKLRILKAEICKTNYTVWPWRGAQKTGLHRRFCWAQACVWWFQTGWVRSAFVCQI